MAKKDDAALRKQKVVEVLPKSLRNPVSKDRLKDITFEDLHNFSKCLSKFFDEDPVTFISKACSTCTKWRP